MSDLEIPSWLKSLPRAPEYRPTETEFADPIAFISRIEREGAAFGICKVIPPLPKPSKRFVLANLNRSLSRSPDLSSSAASAAAAAPDGGAVPGPAPASASAPSPASTAVFTTRHQELGTRRARTPVPFHKQVWQSGERYSLEQFEAKSKAFARAQLGGFKEVTPLLVESLFWKAAAEKPIYVEYANDVPGSGFAAPEEPFKYYTYRRRRRKRECHREKIQEPKCPLPVGSDVESTGSAGWKLSNSPWNLQVIARSPGSLTRFMPDEVPGVTSPMVYIAMLFSWFAWHVEDHELHSLNFLHMGAPKTWYAIPGDHAAALEEIVRVQGYGGNVDRLAALAMLGGKTTLLSPEVLVASGIPCCRLVQNPGEFVVTFPRAYHIGFSHGFNCGEAANFATPQWLKFAKDAAVRRAAMNYLPMLSHQQLLYMLTVSFISRVPGELLPGVRTSRSRDRKKEEREFLIKRAFLHDMMNENQLLCSLHAKESTLGAVLWEPDLLPSSCLVPHERMFDGDSATEMIQCKLKNSKPLENVHEGTDRLASTESQNILSVKTQINACDAECLNSKEETINYEDAEGEADEEDLPFGLRIDSGSLACVACGILGYPFMAILQPSEKALNGLSPVNCEESTQKIEVSQCTSQPSLASIIKKFDSAEESSLNHVEAQDLETSDGDKARIGHQSVEGNTCIISSSQVDLSDGKKQGCGTAILEHPINQLSNQNDSGSSPSRIGIGGTEDDISNMNIFCEKAQTDADRLLGARVGQCDEVTKWNTQCGFLRPRIFCLQHALEIEELLQSKGGAHVLIICHSDYLTIKALAMSIAEEIDVQLDCEDIPLQNASPSDLHLINISIDDEEHEEDGKDWSSSLGVNLQYRAKLRKQSSAKEQLALSLGGIFSDPAPVSVVSNLKWLCKKSRTPCKVVGTSLPRSHLHKDTNKVAHSHCYYEKVDDGNMNNLYAVPITVAEHLQINQLGLCGQSASTSHEVSHSLNSQGSPVDGSTVFVSGREEFEVHSDKSVNTVTLSNPMRPDSDISYYNIPILARFDIPGKATNEYSLNRKQSNVENLEVKEETMWLKDESLQVGETKNLGEMMNSKLDGPQSAKLDSGSSLRAVSIAENSQENSRAEIPDSEGRHTQTLVLEESSPAPVLSSNASDILPEVVDEERRSDAALAKESLALADADLNEIHNSALKTTVVDNSEAKDSSELLQKAQLTNVVKASAEVSAYFEAVVRSGKATRRDIIHYVRRKNKRKREEEQHEADGAYSCVGFIRSPCEGLRPRTGRNIPLESDTPVIPKMVMKALKKPKISTVQGGKSRVEGQQFRCDLEGCRMRFRTRRELSLHKQNRCTLEGCGKRFSSHNYAARHQCVHIDDRPLQCPWKGCRMTFKWAWARTEHVRVHTGERPYECKVAGCGLTFRYISDFSRHRRKTGHYVGASVR